MRLPIVFLFGLLSCAIGATASDLGAVHEWGTFTSVAGEDGAAMGWQALTGLSDLPCFVHHLDQRNLKVAGYATVRMETPVLYFYPLKPLTVSVHVDFPDGRVTEWYPQASGVQPSSRRNGWIEWTNVRASEGGDALPQSGEASHYYAARETDAWPLGSGQEHEKLLFYRGIGNFGIDLNTLVRQDGVSLRNLGSETIPLAIVFENHGGKIRYQSVRGLQESVSVNFSEMNGSVDVLRASLEDELTEMGLYRKEAHAMIQTWHDSWFEEGLRVFYILPRSKVDALLPISIHPTPRQMVRLFVGRVELLSPVMRREIGSALKDGDVTVLQRYGRFINAFMRQLGEVPMSDRARAFLDSAYRQADVESQKTACSGS